MTQPETLDGATRLDAASFPHIIDAVLDRICSTDPVAALHLRAACRKWHATICLRAFSHLSIEQDDAFPTYTVRAYPCTNSKAAPLRLPPQRLVQFSWRLHPTVRAALLHARTLDLQGPLPRNMLAQVYQAVTPSRLCIRLGPKWVFGKESLVLPARSLVVHAESMRTPSAVSFGEAKHVVIHGHEKDLVYTALGILRAARTDHLLESFTLFLSVPLSEDPELDLQGRTNPHSVIDVLKRVDRPILVVWPERAEKPARARRRRDYDGEDWPEIFEGCVRDREWAPPMRFMTEAQYRAAVGEETYRQHTFRVPVSGTM